MASMISRRQLQFGALAMGAGALFAGSKAAMAQSWPSRPVRVVVPFAPGGSTDAVTRPICDILYNELKQPFVIENRGGAGSVTGSQMVASAPPDGYTILSTTASLATSIALKQGSYTVDSFDGITTVARSTFMVLVSKDSPFKTLNGLIAEAKKLDGQMLYATAGIGSSTHFATEFLSMRAGVRMRNVPYTGIGPALIGVLRNDVAFIITTPASAAGQIQDGSIRVLAYTTNAIPEGFPKAPIIKELGYNYDVYSWWAMLAPKGVPTDTLDALNRHVTATLRSDAIAKQYKTIGSDPAPMSRADFTKLFRDEVAQWIDVAKFADIKPG